MFALEIDFHDGVSPPEVLMIRRPSAIIGASELAHVVIEGAASGLCDLRIVRGIGREFQCLAITRGGQPAAKPPFLEGVYVKDAEIALGEVTLHVTALDMDLKIPEHEAPDRAAAQIIRRALGEPSSIFPAVAVVGATPIVVSFPQDQTLLVGRSRRCGLRLDSADISSEHSRFGFENGRFWVEDLGSTNGTFVAGGRVSGRVFLEVENSVLIGAEYRLIGIADYAQLSEIKSQIAEESAPALLKEMYPCVLACSELVRPGRYVLPREGVVTLGRDPANDIWVGVPHVSRHHAEIYFNTDGSVSLIDLSSNGTFLDGKRMPRGQRVPIENGPAVIDLSEGIELTVCFSEDEERLFEARALSGDHQSSNINIGDEADIADSLQARAVAADLPPRHIEEEAQDWPADEGFDGPLVEGEEFAGSGKRGAKVLFGVALFVIVTVLLAWMLFGAF